MFKDYFNSQLRSIRKDAREFARKYPTLAPMLTGQSPDPDVERLLEGVAFLTGLLQEKLDDELPEVIHGLTDLVFPHYLRPLPAVTLIEFLPKNALKATICVREGTRIASKPADGMPSCLFRTTETIELHPLVITNAEYVCTEAHTGIVRISFELQDLPLNTWNPSKLRLFLNSGYSDAADLHMLLCRHTESITITSEGGDRFVLGPGSLSAGGYRDNEPMLPYSPRFFSGYRILQEYFLFPQKFLFLDIGDLETWKNKGSGSRFVMEIRLGQCSYAPPCVGVETFLLHVVPAINLFPMDAEPVVVDQRQYEYPIIPSGGNVSEYEIYSVDSVLGIRQGEVKQRNYVPFDSFHEKMTDTPVYEVKRTLSKIDRGTDYSIGVIYPSHVERYERETLSIALTCSNGKLAEELGPGDISQATSTSPELATFRNIMAPASAIGLPLGSDRLWQLLSHLSLNFLSLSSSDNLKTLLNLYIFPEDRDKARVAANTRKVEGITGLQTRPTQTLVKGLMMRGTEITLSLSQDHFSSPGDLYLFGSVLDYFFGVYSSINSYTQLTIDETITGNSFRWNPRLGERFLF
jgi:type VI secretion system protein ImpG